MPNDVAHNMTVIDSSSFENYSPERTSQLEVHHSQNFGHLIFFPQRPKGEKRHKEGIYSLYGNTAGLSNQ